MVRRNRPHPGADIFKSRIQDHWAIATNPWHKLLWSEHLPAGTDLLRYYIALLLRYHDEGWQLNEFSSYFASFYATRAGDEKRYVQITSTAPAPSQSRPEERAR